MTVMQAKLDVSSKTLLLHSFVHGHHIFKNIWTPYVEEILTLQQEAGNRHDGFAVAVTWLSAGTIVGHMHAQKNVYRIYVSKIKIHTFMKINNLGLIRICEGSD